MCILNFPLKIWAQTCTAYAAKHGNSQNRRPWEGGQGRDRSATATGPGRPGGPRSWRERENPSPELSRTSAPRDLDFRRLGPRTARGQISALRWFQSPGILAQRHCRYSRGPRGGPVSCSQHRAWAEQMFASEPSPPLPLCPPHPDTHAQHASQGRLSEHQPKPSLPSASHCQRRAVLSVCFPASLGTNHLSIFGDGQTLSSPQALGVTQAVERMAQTRPLWGIDVRLPDSGTCHGLTCLQSPAQPWVCNDGELGPETAVSSLCVAQRTESEAPRCESHVIFTPGFVWHALNY